MHTLCPIEGCGRQFENQLTMLQHVKRRHPQQSQKIKQQTTSDLIDKQSKITQEMNKLPKMQRVIQMSKQKKTLEFQRRSTSKKRQQLSNIIENSQNKLNDIITESRQLVDQNTNSRKLLKRPSLSKKSSQQVDKLPSLAQSKVKKLKLEALKSQFNNSTITKQTQIQKLSIKNQSLLQKQSQNAMYSTAPNFTHQMNKKIDLIRSRGKKQGQTSNRSSSKDLKQGNPSQNTSTLQKKRLSSQTMQTLIQSQRSLESVQVKPIQRPIKRLLQRSSKKDNSQPSLLISNDDLSQSAFTQKPQLKNELKKQFAFVPKKRPLSKQDQKFTKKGQSAGGSPLLQTDNKLSSSSSLEDYNWQQRTVTIRNKQIYHFIIPDNSEVEYLYLTNCNINSIDLNQCFSLISLTLTNNNLSSLQFLQSTINGSYQNIESLYLDHNLISSLNSLPIYLQIRNLSLAFNKIYGLDDLLKTLVKFSYLEQLDLSFNPVRKQTNYKLAVLAACKDLKKLDGMIITKFDRQMAAQYRKMYFDYLHIIPLSSSPVCSQGKFRPSTAVSTNYQQQFQSQNPMSEMTQKQLSRQIQILQKMIKNTKQQFEIIQQENNTIEQQIQSYQTDFTGEQKQDDFNPKVYKKLCKQVEELQMLNFLQYCSQKQLEDILVKKIHQKGLSMEILTAN